MTAAIEAVRKTRESTSQILAKTLPQISGKSETEVRDELLAQLRMHAEIFPQGWYDPPGGGVAVLFDAAPFRRLQFETLRNPESWPGESTWTDKSVGMVYLSPVDRSTNMIGDIGLALYTGTDAVIQDHVRTSRDMVVRAAELSEVGMSFSELFRLAMDMFASQGGKVIGWMTTHHDPLKTNLGHTIPGSYEAVVFGESFQERRETIRTRRVYINEIEDFIIPETCAFTLEARLTDLDKNAPNVFFHVIVTFDKGKREILTNFDIIYQSVGMDYML